MLARDIQKNPLEVAKVFPKRSCLTYATSISGDGPAVISRLPIRSEFPLSGTGARRYSAFVPFEAIGHYRVESLIGSGGMGDVFLAEDMRLGRKVAIKRVRADAINPQAHRRLLTEAQATARLDHPHICGIHEVGEDHHGPYIVMPFVEGETLAARLVRGRLPIEDVLALAAQIADALGAAHGLGILHRDIKPANVMVDARGQVRVMDFGLAKFMAPAASPAAAVETAIALTAVGSTLGTAAYMSPEQARGLPTDARSARSALASSCMKW